MTRRRSLLAGLLGLAGAGKAAQAASPEKAALHVPIVFVQQDSVQSFPPTGDGVRVGTVTGQINGTSITNSQFLAVPPPEFQADDLCAVTDLDGDQILFRVQVTGRFLEAFGDSARPSGIVFGLGGPYTGTYEVLKATGKYGYLVGRKFPCKGVGSNPAKGNQPGTVYCEVYSDRFDDRPMGNSGDLRSGFGVY